MILAIDTSGQRCGLALWNGKLLDYTETRDNLRHNEVLLSRLRDLLQRNHFQLSNLKAVAVSSGPGSFTGLRVGMAVAKGLCWSQQLPLITVPTLEGLAAGVPARLKRVVPLMPARASEVYWVLYEYEERSWKQQSDYSVCEVAKLSEVIHGSVFLCGEGFERHYDALVSSFASRRLVIDETESLEPLVISTARLAERRYLDAQCDDLKASEPEYFYPFPITK
jgi:tRNA threonylcarbamoyladenosine biosynthesis protein TsaB